jgi:hypothetical protein
LLVYVRMFATFLHGKAAFGELEDRIMTRRNLLEIDSSMAVSQTTSRRPPRRPRHDWKNADVMSLVLRVGDWTIPHTSTKK